MTWALLLTLAASIVFQLTALPLYKIGSFGPDFVLLLLSYAALEDRPRRAIPLASLSGLLLDGLSADPWGTHALGYGMAAWLLRRLRRGGWARARASRLFLAMAAALLAGLVRLVLVCARGDSRPFLEALSLSGAVLYSGALSLPLFSLLDAFRHRLIIVPLRRLKC